MKIKLFPSQDACGREIGALDGKKKVANLSKRLKNAKLGFPKKQMQCFAWDKGVSEQRLMFAVSKLALARLTTCGELSEWLNVSLSKSDKVKAFGGSNPPLSAKCFTSKGKDNATNNEEGFTI